MERMCILPLHTLTIPYQALTKMRTSSERRNPVPNQCLHTSFLVMRVELCTILRMRTPTSMLSTTAPAILQSVLLVQAALPKRNMEAEKGGEGAQVVFLLRLA